MPPILQWLTYWVVYSTFTLIESATDVLALWIPLYPVVKVTILMASLQSDSTGHCSRALVIC